MSRPDKKQRHKAKREAKRRENKRRESISPIKRLANAPGEIECWMSNDFAGFGQAQIFVYKRAAGLSGMASFLVDKGVVGLKDAWTRMNVDRTDFQDMLDASDHRGIPMRRATLDDARRMVAGGIRWAHEHGMRLPKDWIKPAALLGGVGDCATADVSAFAKEFAGHPEDLRQRLISEPFDTFICRTDIQFVFSDDAPYTDQSSGEYNDLGDLDDEDDVDEDETDDRASAAADIPEEELHALLEQLTPAVTALAAETAAWQQARGQTPSPDLVEAWRSLMFATMLAKAAMPDASKEELGGFNDKLFEEISRPSQEPGAVQYPDAVRQVAEHVHADPQLIQRVMPKLRLGQ